MPKKKRKKVSSAGKFGPRYGFTLRKRYEAVDAKIRRRYRCPSCGAEKVKRVGTAIWECRRCGVKFAGGAYTAVSSGAEPTTRGGVT